MARNERLIPASPERVFAVLSDPDSYGHWVVGSDTIRDADPEWPRVGARFHHRIGVGPFKLNDHTEVIAMEPDRHLELHAKARPLGTAHVVLDLERRGGGTNVTMVEDAGDRLTKLVFNPLTHFLVRRRNDESLRRLEELAVGR
ncbi:SRPBCC family protein [Conexibacter woesei]|uniref:SRPBCC family protein n=1 Tax=Conexibacter woesei TaxID=191495 RepID=UPI00041AD4F3|nr:SRPBCC domain-containing protein [Conexibacter woesei]